MTDAELFMKMRASFKEAEAFVEAAADRIEAQAAEIKRLEKACAEWAEVSLSNYQRAKAAEAKLAKAVGYIELFISEDETNRGDEPMPEYDHQTWDEINEHWIKHLDEATAFVAEVKGAKT